MKINRHQVVAFAAVGREKSFSRAAETLSLGQSAVTQHISALERAIGAKLFIRSRAGTELTRVGRELYSLADRIRVLEEQFLERANQYADLNVGNLSVCVSTPRPAMAVIAAYQRCFPGVRIELLVAPWRDAVALIRQREVDVAIVIQPECLEGLYSIEIERRPFLAVLPKQHPLAAKATIDAAELTNETLILLSDASYTRFWVDKKFSEIPLTPTKTLITPSYEMMLEAVVHGLGVSIALTGAVSQYEQVSMVPIKEFTEEHSFAVVCAEDKAMLRTIGSFLNVAAQGRRPGDVWEFDHQASNSDEV
ncbi:MAG: LysR family transcriptional regulator [Candidatus Competibacteraceae bacterium]